MRCSSILILMLNSFCTFSQITHEFVYVVGCPEDGSTQVQYVFDDEELFYTDFDRQRGVFTGPPFVVMDQTYLAQSAHFYINAMKAKRTCKIAQAVLKAEGIKGPEETDPPESVLYPADEVQPGVENSLTCFVNHFYPPGIKVSWTKNGSPVTEGVSLSRYFPNKDQTFHQFSTLKFTPEEGDIYSCTVEHLALDRPQTRIWNVEMSHPSVGATVFCGVGLTLGLLGVAVGTFLMAKGHTKQ
ncbi:H-2 class II histocompatibility antigen, A-U alpha chain-like [Halichoeres trimaculatus]|uniref:H-2 class II histocompatibility antigen, A-U alpha chain-like n=1 Tax=Halichoeres trimaculatus TaxID=147232 RepID=UPI003D9ECA6D